MSVMTVMVIQMVLHGKVTVDVLLMKMVYQKVITVMIVLVSHMVLHGIVSVVV